MDAAELFVLPSIVLLEAASLKVPVVASGVGGVPEILTDGETGRIVAPEDPAELADAIDCLLRDRETAAAYAARFARVAVDRFSWQAAADQSASLFHFAPEDRWDQPSAELTEETDQSLKARDLNASRSKVAPHSAGSSCNSPSAPRDATAVRQESAAFRVATSTGAPLAS